MAQNFICFLLLSHESVRPKKVMISDILNMLQTYCCCVYVSWGTNAG